MSDTVHDTRRTIEDLASPLCLAHGVEIVDVQVGREPGGAVVRVIIDRVASRPDEVGSGVSLDDCQRVSRDLSSALDVHDVIEGSYRLEVSSPGLERPLVKRTDFERFKGREVKVQTRVPLGEPPRKRFHGELVCIEEATVRLSEDGHAVDIPFDEIAHAHLVHHWSGSSRPQGKQRHKPAAS